MVTTEEKRDPAIAERLVKRMMRRAAVGRTLVALAVFAPALLIVGLFLLSRGSIYSRAFPGPAWPWIAADVTLLLVGVRLMRGEDL